MSLLARAIAGDMTAAERSALDNDLEELTNIEQDSLHVRWHRHGIATMNLNCSGQSASSVRAYEEGRERYGGEKISRRWEIGEKKVFVVQLHPIEYYVGEVPGQSQRRDLGIAWLSAALGTNARHAGTAR